MRRNSPWIHDARFDCVLDLRMDHRQGRLVGGLEMSHHKSIYMIVDGTEVEIGYVRITNELEILSIWIPHMKKLFKPEGSE